jgi:hypothetical protein
MALFYIYKYHNWKMLPNEIILFHQLFLNCNILLVFLFYHANLI